MHLFSSFFKKYIVNEAIYGRLE